MDRQDNANQSNADPGGNHAGQPNAHLVTIIINGRPKQVPRNEELDFAEVVALSGQPPVTGPEQGYTVQYTNGPGRNPSGTLVAGGRAVKIKEGMEFDVTPTNRS
jgi:hypothetical protein